MVDPVPTLCANHVYYFDIGLGNWIGEFRYKIINWGEFWSDKIGLKNRFLALTMAVTMGLFRRAKITSVLSPSSAEGKPNVVTNDVRITKFGIVIYLLLERYILDPDCCQVEVQSKERFGPIPFLFNVRKQHPAEIVEEGKGAIYYIPLLGTSWIGRYKVAEDHNHIRSVLTCRWAEAEEVIERVS